MDIKFPVEVKEKYGVKVSHTGASKETLIGYEMWATQLAFRDGIKNILLDPTTPWTKLFEQAYKYQLNGKDLGLDIYWIDYQLKKDIGLWEGFRTSFNWNGIKFVDVFIQLVVGQRYYLPKILIEQIKDKIDAKLSKLDARVYIGDKTNIDWNNDVKIGTNYFQENLSNLGVIKNT